jgi:hypothetical protein
MITAYSENHRKSINALWKKMHGFFNVKTDITYLQLCFIGLNLKEILARPRSRWEVK